MSETHFVRDYRALVKTNSSVMNEDKAMAASVGGNFDAVGQVEADLLVTLGMRDGMSVVDVGCGSGRAAVAVARSGINVSYLGTDIVQPLLDYAARVCPKQYRFVLVDGLTVPTADASIDFAFAFSVFTHLRHEEIFLYMRDIHRILKSGGSLVFSYLEFDNPNHWPVFEHTVAATEQNTPSHLNMFIERSVIQKFADALGFDIVSIQADVDNEVVLSREVVYDNGIKASGRAYLGQSVCHMRKR